MSSLESDEPAPHEDATVQPSAPTTKVEDDQTPPPGPPSVDWWLAFFNRNHPHPGAGDIVSAGPDRDLDRAASFVAAIVALCRPDGAPLFKHIAVVVPPTDRSPLDVLRRLFTDRIASEFLARRGRALSPGQISKVAGRLGIYRPQTLETEALVAELQALPSESAVLTTDTARYRSKGPDVPAATIPFIEGRWVPHFHDSARKLLQVAKSRELYVVLDAGQFQPLRQSNRDLLESIDDCGVVAGRPHDDPEAQLLNEVSRWEEHLSAGRLGAIISTAEAIPGLTDQQRSFLRAAALQYVGRPAEALATIRAQVDTIASGADADMILKVARIAMDAHDVPTAETLLAAALPNLHHEEQFWAVLGMTRLASSRHVSAAAATELERLYPHSLALLRHKIRVALNAQQYQDVADLAKGLSSANQPSPEVHYYALVAMHLGATDGPRYRDLLREITDSVPAFRDRACLLCSQDALLRGRHDDALDIAALVSPTSDLSFDAIDTALLALERQLLMRTPEGRSVDSDERLRSRLAFLVAYLGRNPSDGANRVDLARILSVQVAGLRGFSLLGEVAIASASRAITFTPENLDRTTSGVSDAFEEFTSSTLEALAANQAFILGLGDLPTPISLADADSYLRPLTALIQETGDHLADDADVNMLLILLHFGMLLAHRSSTPDEDLVLLRLAAGQLAGSGRAQIARDIVESALQAAGASSSPRRRRLAWAAFADVYHRAHNLPEALLGVAVLLSISDAQMSAEQAWHETFLLIRLFRDLDFPEFALALLPGARKLVELTSLRRTGAVRLDTVELGIRLRALLVDPPANRQDMTNAWRDLLNRLSVNCEAARRANDETAPACTLLARAIAEVQILGLPIEQSIRNTLAAALKEVSPSLSARVQALCEPKPGLPELTALLTGLEYSRFADDVGSDLSLLTPVAKRVLAGDLAIADAAAIILAIELLTDHSFSVGETVDDVKGRSGAQVPLTAEPIVAFLRTLSAGDRVVHLMGLDENRALVRVTAVHGALGAPIREPADVFSPAAYHTWRTRYPYRYADLDTPAAVASNEARASVFHLGISHSPTISATILVPSVSLQQLPGNLLFADDDFLGQHVPVATIPSISWLQRSRTTPRKRNYRRVAWISTEHRTAAPGTLTQVAERLRPVLDDFRMDLNTASVPPPGLRAADLAIVAAHGGLLPEGRFFQVVSDEHSLRVSARDLANLVGGSAVAILFICSAGRSDDVPFSNASVGLAKLVLDAGCRAVVASPWPLDARVPPHWLPAFLRASTDGHLLAEATFYANKAVAKALGDVATHALAMHVIGDPDIGPRDWLTMP